jgi:signal transduction histidine kinase
MTPETARSRNPSLSENAMLAFVEKVENLSLFQDRIEKPTSMPQIWDAFREEIEGQITSSAIALFLVDQTTHGFELCHWTPPDCDGMCRREIDAQIECGTFAWIVNRRLPAVIPSLAFKGPQTLVMLPMATHFRTLGVAMIVTTIEEKTVTHERLRLLGILSKQCALVMENTLLYEQLKAEHAALQTAQAQIIQAEKFASFGRLTSGAFHELLNPLNIISGHLQLMMMAEDLKAPWSEYLPLMKSASDRIVAIVNGLLKFSLKRSSKGAAFDVVAVLRQLVDEAVTRRSNRHVAIKMAAEQRLPPLTVQEEDFKTVINHLLDNAFDAMPEGGNLEIGVGYAAHDMEDGDDQKVLEIRIADNGSGIPESITHKVFDPFFTTKALGEGMGLGLAVSYALVCAMGGTLAFDSKIKEGTVFYIRLPSLDDR